MHCGSMFLIMLCICVIHKWSVLWFGLWFMVLALCAESSYEHSSLSELFWSICASLLVAQWHTVTYISNQRFRASFLRVCPMSAPLLFSYLLTLYSKVGQLPKLNLWLDDLRKTNPPSFKCLQLGLAYFQQLHIRHMQLICSMCYSLLPKTMASLHG